MKRPVGIPAFEARLPFRARAVPVVSTIMGSLLSALPVVASAPIMPPTGLIVAIGWRLLRPELWRAWVGLPLGLVDDLFTGQPPGSGMILWTFSFLLIDAIDARVIWRDYWLDWLIAAGLIVACLLGGWWLTALVVHAAPGSVRVVAPQILISIFCFPLIARLCAMLDRWRLGR